jgi:starch-binding outer membrane protein, SusD/RagB family
MKYIKLISLAAVVFAVGSCKKFLDTKPSDFIQAAVYYQNAQQLTSALAGVYSPISRYNLYGFNYTALAMVATDEVYFSAAVGGANGIAVNDFDYTNVNVSGIWSSCYEGIENANLLIANIGNAKSVDTATRNAILGEAIFLRGYYHFMLAQHFGGVPIKITPTTDPNNVDIPRAPLKDVYAQIVKDMQQAESMVYANAALLSNSSSRVTRPVVQGMLARVYLFMAGYPLNDPTGYQNALTYTSKVINGGFHGLNTAYESNPVNVRGGVGDSLAYPLTNGNPGYVNNPYSQVFLAESRSQYLIRENMWEVDNSAAVPGGALAGGNIGSQVYGITNNASDYGVLGRSATRINASQWLYTSYGDGDFRRDWNISPYNFTGVPNRRNFLPVGTAASGNLFNRPASKWRREYEPVGVGAPDKGGWPTGIKYPLLRYADVLLMFAEAENQVNGATPAAINAINQVRRRAYGLVNGTAPIKTITITNQGTGYTTAPTITITGGGGTWASASTTVTAGKVSGVTMVNRGIGFSSAPTVTITGAGTGATATATLFTTADVDLQAGMGKTQFQDSLVVERARELCFESLRKGDLIRWGIYLNRMQELSNYNVSTGISPTNSSFVRSALLINNTLTAGQRILLMPIPAAEINMNRAMTQNPGW